MAREKRRSSWATTFHEVLLWRADLDRIVAVLEDSARSWHDGNLKLAAAEHADFVDRAREAAENQLAIEEALSNSWENYDRQMSQLQKSLGSGGFDLPLRAPQEPLPPFVPPEFVPPRPPMVEISTESQVFDDLADAHRVLGDTVRSLTLQLSDPNGARLAEVVFRGREGPIPPLARLLVRGSDGESSAALYEKLRAIIAQRGATPDRPRILRRYYLAVTLGAISIVAFLLWSALTDQPSDGSPTTQVFMAVLVAGTYVSILGSPFHRVGVYLVPEEAPFWSRYGDKIVPGVVIGVVMLVVGTVFGRLTAVPASPPIGRLPTSGVATPEPSLPDAGADVDRHE